MIEFFAGSVIEYLKTRLPEEYCFKLVDSNDSQNAIQFETNGTFVFWKLSANIEINQFELNEVITNKSFDLNSDNNYNFVTVLEAIQHIIMTVVTVKPNC